MHEDDKQNEPGAPITSEDKASQKPLSDKEKEIALDHATLAEQQALAAKREEMAEALKHANPAELSDHVKAELGIEERPAKVSEEVKEVKEEIEMAKDKLVGKKHDRDTLRNPAEKARTNPSSGPKTKQGRMFGKRGKKGK